jgi:hypothetical protein
MPDQGRDVTRRAATGWSGGALDGTQAAADGVIVLESEKGGT